ncbi:hypothetical protein OE88DRAFT_1286615 [Heliocybe sulcata]|uniref:Uncharacterized protein n=1 Tax=Heliocybe sulcata TaxID=5364 RepID=A0A5C3N7N6_9AGAM|nr:hypothetical protein OE88DRAFT_1286615 [Heliocybe sulcata]
MRTSVHSICLDEANIHLLWDMPDDEASGNTFFDNQLSSHGLSCTSMSYFHEGAYVDSPTGLPSQRATQVQPMTMATPAPVVFPQQSRLVTVMPPMLQQPPMYPIAAPPPYTVQPAAANGTDHLRTFSLHPFPNAAAALGVYYPGQTIAGQAIETGPRPRGMIGGGGFQLAVYRGAKRAVIDVEHNWDDYRLLVRISEAYDRLRAWRKYLSLKSLSSFTTANADYMFPQVTRSLPSASSDVYKEQRIRRFLRHPEVLRGKTEGVWSHFYDTSTAFTIGSYMVGAESACLVLVGILNWAQF